MALHSATIPRRSLDKQFKAARSRHLSVIADPFGNSLTILDLTRGRYVTDSDGNVTGVSVANEAST